MNRTKRIAILGALALLVALAGTAVANLERTAETPVRQLADEHDAPPDQDESEEPPDDVAVQRVADRLGTDPERVRALAAEHGFGTAVRLLAWEAAGADTDDVLRRRAAGQGWGVIAKDLELDVHPGLGSIIGNGAGHGREHAPGQQKDRGNDD